MTHSIHLTFDHVYSLNGLEINANCTNLWLGYNYCVAPYPPLSSTTAAPQITSNYSIGTMNTSPLPTGYTPTFYTVAWETAGIPAPTNVANGTRELGPYTNFAQT